MSWGMPAILSQSNVLTKQTANYLLNGKLKLHNNMGTASCCCCSAIRGAAHARPSLICCQTQQPRISTTSVECYGLSHACFYLRLSSNVTTRVWIDNLYHIKPGKYHGVGTLRYIRSISVPTDVSTTLIFFVIYVHNDVSSK